MYGGKINVSSQSNNRAISAGKFGTAQTSRQSQTKPSNLSSVSGK